jgi:hypothetical protein
MTDNLDSIIPGWLHGVALGELLAASSSDLPDLASHNVDGHNRTDGTYEVSPKTAALLREHGMLDDLGLTSSGIELANSIKAAIASW